jgi:hypothetical protein
MAAEISKCAMECHWAEALAIAAPGWSADADMAVK